jgi:broad specificity phosphatase PhoE
MVLPRELVCVRHGQSKGNVAIRASREGDDRHFTEDFYARPSVYWRLTPEGIQQANIAGAWIRKHIGERFDGCFVSELIRAKETAAHLGLPDALWVPKSHLVERNRGHLDIITRRERRERYAKELTIKEGWPYSWTPPGGESIAMVRDRIHPFLNLLHREYENGSVIVVTHGEIIDAIRMTLEFKPIEEYNRIRRSKDPKDHTHNCQVIHYTRRKDPHNPDDQNLSDYLGWVRSVCTTDPSRSKNGWERIERQSFTNEELLAEVEAYR